MAKYRVTTDNGTYLVETADAASAPPSPGVLDKPFVGPDSALYPAAEGIREGAQGVGPALSGAAGFLKNMVEHPLDTISSFTAPVSAGPKIETTGPNAYQLPPDPVLRTIGTIARNVGAYLLPGTIQQATPERNQEAQGFAGQNAAAAVTAKAIESIPRAASAVNNAASQFAAKRIATAQAATIDNLATVIQPGIKNGPPQLAAESFQPFIKQATQELGFKPDEILPKTEKTPGDLLRGGTKAQLDKVNTQLKAEYVTAGGDPAKFVPADSISMALTERAVDIADRPIANAVEAVQNRSIPQEQARIAQRLRSEAGGIAGADPSLSNAFIRTAEAVERDGGTVGGLNGLKQHFNKETGRFYRGSPSSQNAATAAPVYAQKLAADLIREELYPWLEKNTTATGIADAGRAEAAAISAQDGAFQSWTQSAGRNANAAIQKFWDYVTKGPEGVAHGVMRPSSTAASMLARAASHPFRTMPLGEFNEALRRGIGDMRNFTPANASVTATTTAQQGGYPVGRGQAAPLNVQSTAQAMPQSLTPQPPVVKSYPTSTQERGYSPTQSKTLTATAADYLNARRKGFSIEDYLHSK